jgi:hypothetical protein
MLAYVVDAHVLRALVAVVTVPIDDTAILNWRVAANAADAEIGRANA